MQCTASHCLLCDPILRLGVGGERARLGFRDPAPPSLLPSSPVQVHSIDNLRRYGDGANIHSSIHPVAQSPREMQMYEERIRSGAANWLRKLDHRSECHLIVSWRIVQRMDEWREGGWMDLSTKGLREPESCGEAKGRDVRTKLVHSS